MTIPAATRPPGPRRGDDLVDGAILLISERTIRATMPRSLEQLSIDTPDGAR